MASLAMTTSFLGGAARVADRSPASRRRLVVPRAIRAEAQEAAAPGGSRDSKLCGGRRAAMLVVAAAAVAAVGGAGAGVAVAREGEPKPGSPEAKKKYAAVCLTMPTASVCRK